VDGIVAKKPEERIRRALRKSPSGLHLVAIAKNAGLSRTTVSKYILAMESRGEVEIRNIGPSKLVRLKKRGGE